jgi:alpha-tubulin suppressor-like RCC1 family protein
MQECRKISWAYLRTRRSVIQACLLCMVLSIPTLQPSIAFTQPVTKVAAYGHSLFLKSDGTLWAMGDNLPFVARTGGGGELGDGTYNPTNRPEQIVAGNVTTIAAGDGFSLFLKSDGSLWAMGDQSFGELGDGTYGIFPNLSTNRPEQIVSSNVTAIAAGSWHSLFLKSDGSLWAMGWNQFGQLGDGTYNNTNRPEQIVSNNVTAIAAGGAGFSLFLKSDGSLWAMGVGYNTNLPEQIVASNVKAIAAGFLHSLFLKDDGSLWSMGWNEYGQLGDGTYNSTFTIKPEQIVASNVTAIVTGSYHSLFLKSDGSLWAMGDNEWGQLGDSTYNTTNQPEQIMASDVTAISAGAGHSLFLKSDGSLWAMGNNYYGQLGDGTYNYAINLPEQIVAGPPGYGYNQMSIQLLSGGDICSYFGGVSGTNYALDRTFNLAPLDWMPQVTNPANVFGVAAFTNTPDPTANNYWRVRSVQ